MFVSDTHLPQLLEPSHYLDAAVLAAEIDRGFLPAWHLVASAEEFPADGHYVTRELLGRDLLLWRSDGAYHCFLNVCSHRFCALTCRPAGRFEERIRCQYHGWEFDATGQTRRIPDAPSFRPLEQGRLGLTTYRTATAGDLVFVSLHPDPQPLEAFLGPAHALCAERCGGEWAHAWSWNPVCEGNWKLATEITLEGYHAGETHAASLGRYPLPREEAMSHDMPDPRHCGLRVRYSENDHREIRSSVRHLRRLGREPEFVYHHHHAFPHFGIIASDGYAIAQSIHPLTPTSHMNLYRLYVYRGRPRRGFTGAAQRLHARGLAAFWAQVFAEDRAMTAAHQRGIASAERPDGGLLSRREERVVHFQRYILGLLGDRSAPAPV